MEGSQEREGGHRLGESWGLQVREGWAAAQEKAAQEKQGESRKLQGAVPVHRRRLTKEGH